MSSAVDIQIVSQPNLVKIENFFKDSSYRETIEFSANFNTRLCIERRLRLPFLDPQTGVAQNHSQLFMHRRNRMPGFREGQIYTYPSARWRKSRRQYLSKMYRFPDRPFQALRKEHEALTANSSAITVPLPGTLSGPSAVPAHHETELINGNFLPMEESSSLGAAGGDTSDSKDSQQQQQQLQLKEDLPKEWFYDDMEDDIGALEEPKSPADDEYDYDPRYGNKKRRKRRPGKRATLTPGEGTGRRRSGAGRGRSNAAANQNQDRSFAGLSAIDGVPGEAAATPTTSGGRRSRGAGTRGRRRAKANNSSALPLSPGLNSEPPTFEMAAAAFGVGNDTNDEGDLRNYRKYL